MGGIRGFGGEMHRLGSSGGEVARVGFVIYCQDCAAGVLRARGLRSVEPGEPQGTRGETT